MVSGNRLGILKIGPVAIENLHGNPHESNLHDQVVSRQCTVNSAVLKQVILKANERSGNGLRCIAALQKFHK